MSTLGFGYGGLSLGFAYGGLTLPFGFCFGFCLWEGVNLTAWVLLVEGLADLAVRVLLVGA